VHSCKILARYVYNKFHQSGSQNISVYVGSNWCCFCWSKVRGSHQARGIFMFECAVFW
jgi:hypothetical protein